MLFEMPHAKLTLNDHVDPAIREKEEAMKCKFCQAELEEGAEVCPSCGELVSHTKKPGSRKLAVVIVLIGACLLVLLAAVMYGVKTGWGIVKELTPSQPQGAPAETVTTPVILPGDGVATKVDYTASDEAVRNAADTVVATLGGKELTNSQLQVYYWTQFYDFVDYYYGYLDSIGLDYTKPLHQQVLTDSTTTWQQYFLESGLDVWRRYVTLGILRSRPMSS